ncbi:MAG: LysM peptidoglycan-binding domain-containing protein [Deltaproteobacteria bacterium]|nr:LysM peptidoglycan-binding domain-containing protein [Deltaproteobacteria bacterium]
MGTYRIRSGDTLWALAQKHGTTVDALLRANPQITNRRLIVTGQKLEIPGYRDEFVPARPSRPARPARPTGPVPAPPSGGERRGASAPFEIAKDFLGWNASRLKVAANTVGKAMFDWVPNNVNCANFVSGVLVAAGQLPRVQVDASVRGLMTKLDNNPDYRRVSLRDARPGDVVSMKTRGGHHVVFFAGWRDGRPLFLGSNNVNADGTQKVSWGQFDYPILTIHQYRR